MTLPSITAGPAEGPRVSSVSRRLLRRVLAIYVLVSLAIFGVEMSVGYQQIRDAITNDLDTLHGVFDPSVTYALWHMDSQQLDFAMDAIVRMPSVRRVELRSPEGRVLRDMQATTPLGRLAVLIEPQPIVDQRSLSHQRGAQQIPLGTLYIHSDARLILNQMAVGLVLTAVAALVKSALLVWLFTLFFHRILSRPLGRVAAMATALRPGREPMRSLPVNDGESDELDAIARAINALLSEVDRALAHQAALADGLVQKVAQLEQAQNSLIESEKMAALGALVAGVAHEINTPVGLGLTGSSHLLYLVEQLVRKWQEGRLERQDLERFLQDAKELSGSIFSSLERAAELIRSFNLVAVDQGHGELRSFQPATYLADVVLTHNTMLKRAQVALSLDVDPSLSTHSDPGAWAQILSNLINNAVIHGFRDRPASAQIRISLCERDGQLELRFRDNGCGMKPEVARKVFDPFFTTKRGQGGSGLGMHIVYNLVTQRLHGSIRLETAEGQGSEFVIRLPLSRASEPLPPQHRGTGTALAQP